MIIVALGTWFISEIFLELYGMGIDTIFLCFLDDLERNDGSSAKPYYMPKEMQKTVNDFNDILTPSEKGEGAKPQDNDDNLKHHESPKMK